MTWTIPNILTLLRFVMVPFFLIFILQSTFTARMISLAIFIIAAITDFLDGKIARIYNMKSEFGKFADPLADKFLVAAALIAFVQIEETLIPFWLVLLILSREFIITGLRVAAINKQESMETSNLGKVKTTAQMVSITVILLLLIIRSYFLELPDHSVKGEWDWVKYSGSNLGLLSLKYAPLVLMGLNAILALLSGVRYVITNKHLFFTSGQPADKNQG